VRIIGMVLSVWLAVGIGTWTQAQEGITVTGTGLVSLPPDMASISLGVTERAPTAGEAMALVSGSVAAMLTKLEEMDVAPADRQTSGLYLRPVFGDRQREAGTPPDITGYEAGNNLTITVRDLTTLGALLDAVISEGVNDFNGLRFGLQDDAAAQAQARRKAVEDAMAKAAQLADAAGLELGRITMMREGGQGGGPRPMEMSAMRSMDVPVEAGEVGITAQVTMVYNIAP